MAATKLSDEALLAFFASHPDLRDRMASIVGAVENSAGDLEEADAAEERLVEEMRLLGREAMQGWAERRVEATEREARLQAGTHRQGKKKLQWHTKFGEITVLEPQYRLENNRVRPFLRSAKVSPRGCSRPLQRAITDFAADQPFALARMKLREHYGFEIGESTIQRITLGHAGAIFASGRDEVDFPRGPGQYKQIVAETDGGMIPVMAPDASQKDKRKGKTLSWREAKISLAHAKGSRTPIYGGGIEGGVEAAGQRLFACAVGAGFGADSRVHAVGDGAPWIVGQIEERFGDQGICLIDFYHVCEYLGVAAKMIAADPAVGKTWMEAPKDALKTGRIDEVLGALAPHREAPAVSDDQAPVRVCHRYSDGRKDQLKYREALAEGLPIGSGEIESAHRYLAQKRLKLPGAWWRVENAERMLALRINRLNGDGEAYWAAFAANPPAPANLNRPNVSRNAAA